MPADLRETTSATDDDETLVAVEPRRRFELLEDCRDMVVSRLARVIGEALDRISDELTAAALKEARRDAQQAMLDAVSLVRMHRSEIELRFRQSFSDLFERRMFDRAGPAHETVAPEELSLVGDEAIDGRIAVDRMVQRTRNKLDPDEVLGVRARLAALLDRDWFEEDEHPASPEAVFEALRQTLDELAPAAEVRSALLQAFEPHVSANLNQVYSSVNERLRTNRILPKIKPRVQTAPGARRTERAADAGAPGAAAAGHGAMAYGAAGYGGEAGGVALPASAAGNRGFGGPGSGAAGRPGAPEGKPGLEAFTELIRQISAGQPSARRSAARLLSDPGTFGMADLPVPSVDPPVIQALHSMQAMPPPASGAPLATQMLDQVRDKGSALDQLTVEIVSLVFDYIYADRRLPDAVKQQLLRLQVVAVKAALIDRSFFARRQHPMRRLIDRISDLATDPDADVAHGSTLVDGIAGIVDWIIEHFDSDLSTFEESMDRLDVLAHAESERRAARMVELTREAERLEALTLAQEEARAEIALRIDPVTPAFVREFLYRWWSRALAHARVDGQAAPASWSDSLHAGELLIWSVAPKAPEDIAKLASLLPRLIGGLTKGLQSVGIEPAERERFFNELLQWHTRSIQDAKLNPSRPRTTAPTAVRMSADGQVRFEAPAAPAVGQGHASAPAAGATGRAAAGQAGPGHAGAAFAGGPAAGAAGESAAGAVHAGATPGGQPPSARRDRTLSSPSAGEARVDALVRGDLVEIVEADGAARALKLAWISPTRKLYVLTRFPDVGRSLSRSELAGMFESGRARRVDQASTLDRAIDAIAQPEAA